jgi:hypothetical protein
MTKRRDDDPHSYAFQIWHHDAKGWTINSWGHLKKQFCFAFVEQNAARLLKLLPHAWASNAMAAQNFPEAERQRRFDWMPDFTVLWQEGDETAAVRVGLGEETEMMPAPQWVPYWVEEEK